jgi:monofunctional biosynthetic peptidoglycan transglycosylase
MNQTRKDFPEKIKSLKESAISIALSPYRLFKSICYFFGFLVVLFIFIGSLLTFNFMNELPDIKNKKFASFKRDAVLRTHKKFSTEKKRKYYFWRSINKVNRQLLYSIVMSEDSTFFSHNGVNFNAMIDSLAKNIRNRSYSSGASTITQQVVKNVYLNNEKSLIRKLKEILIARSLEKKYTKNQILEVYLNIAEFGPDLYGVGMSGSRLFKKTTDKIKAGEGAYMALMLPSPRKYFYSIYQNKYLSPANRKKMKRILRDMRYLEYLSPSQYRNYTKNSYFKSFE